MKRIYDKPDSESSFDKIRAARSLSNERERKRKIVSYPSLNYKSETSDNEEKVKTKKQ